MSKKLLIADDARVIREIIKTAALRAGWEVVGEAANGREAAELHAATRPDVCTLDLIMPEYDGLYALRAIRAAAADAKVVMVSAMEQKSLLQEAMKLGAANFIIKPFHPKALLECLEHLACASRSAVMELPRAERQA